MAKNKKETRSSTRKGKTRKMQSTSIKAGRHKTAKIKGFTHQLTFSFRPVISENLDTIHIIELKIRNETFSSF